MTAVGTSYGLFEALLRQRVGLFAVFFFDNCSDQAIAEICKKRDSGYIPFYECDGEFLNKAKLERSDLPAFFAWLCKNIAYFSRAIEFPAEDDPHLIDAFKVSLLALQPAFLASDFLTQFGALKTTPETYVPRAEDINFGISAIDEALALVTQVTWLRNGGAFSDREDAVSLSQIVGAAEGIVRRHLDDPSQLYVRALKAFEQKLPLQRIEDSDQLAMFAIMADIALNPRLPPFCPVEAGVPLNFDDLLPARRFQRLLDIVPHVPLPPPSIEIAPAEVVSDYRCHLVSRAGLSTWEPEEARQSIALQVASLGSFMTRVNAVPAELLFRAANQSISLREKVPYFFANPVDVWTRKEWKHVFEADDFDLAWRCPLTSLSGKTVYNILDSTKAQEVVFAQIAVRFLVDFATTLGSPSYDDFPSDAHFQLIASQVEPWLRQRYNGSFAR